MDPKDKVKEAAGKAAEVGASLKDKASDAVETVKKKGSEAAEAADKKLEKVLEKIDEISSTTPPGPPAAGVRH